MKRIDPVLVVLWGGTAMMVIALVMGVIAHRGSEPAKPTPPSFYPFALSDEQVCDVCLFYGLESGGCDDCTGTGGTTYVTWPSWEELGFPEPEEVPSESWKKDCGPCAWVLQESR